MKLKEYVQQHKHELDSFSAPDDMWQGIENKLKKERKAKTRWFGVQPKTFVWRAAAAVALIIVSLVVKVTFVNDLSKDSVAKNYPEVIETEQYYNAMLSSKIQRVKQHSATKQLKANELLAGIDHLEKQYGQLRQDLDDNADNTQVINAMIENYRARLEMLEIMLKQLEKEDNKNEKSIDI